MYEFERLGRSCRTAVVFALIAATAGVYGCPSRTITIQRAEVINNAQDPEGRPLEVDIVSVYPGDLMGANLDYNELLLPDRDVTADVWFDKRPTAESMKKDPKDTDRFRIHKSQIISFTKEKDFYGTYPNNDAAQGGAIRGSRYKDRRDKNGEIVVKNVPIRYRWDVWDDKLVIYVFAKFDKGKEGAVQDTVKFYKVGDYTDKVTVKIESKEITRVTEPTFNKSRDPATPSPSD
jgi:hypothetical protein